MSAPVRSSHPISFSFLNDDDQPLMDIVDGSEGRDMKLEITNNSRRAMKLVGETGADAATADKHRFELKFRPGTLNPAADITVDGGDGGWLISKPGRTNGAVSLYLLNKNEVSLAAGASLSLTLRHVSADGRGGARGTRVELKYRGLQYVPGQGAETLPDGEREQHLSIVNQRGQKHIPLHVGFVGSDTILNDGRTPNTRILRITNLLKGQSIPLSTTGSAVTKFILSFDVYDPRERSEWALAGSADVKAIEVQAIKMQDGLEVPDPSWAVVKNEQGQAPEWVITPQNKTRLEAAESIQLKLSNIKSQMRSGQAAVYLRYENIYGYWDGHFITSLEKSNLVQRDQLKDDGSYTQSSFIGIGTDNPKSHLDVNGVANIWGGEHFAASNGRMKPGSLTIGSTSASYGGNTTGWDGNNVAGLLLETLDHTEIAVHNHNRRLASLMFYEGGDVNRLTVGRNMGWDSLSTLALNGKVGIGTSEPGTSKLRIANSASDFAHFRFSETGMGELEIVGWPSGWNINTRTPGKSLHLNRDTSSDVLIGANGKELTVKGDSGNVGIGTNNPNKNRLAITRQLGSDDVATFQHELQLEIRNQLGVYQSRSVALGLLDNGKGVLQVKESNVGYNDLLLNPVSGNVGVGTTNPSVKLHVAGDSRFDGNVGIGTTNPAGHLEISNPQCDWIFLRQQRSSQAGGFHIHNPWGEGNSEDRNRLEIAYRTAAGEDKWGQFVIHGPSGRVGIGKPDPTAPLHVGFSQRANHWIKDQYAFLAYRYEEHHDNWHQVALTGRGQPQYFDDASILAEGRIIGVEFNSFSDSRIKENVSTSESKDDLSVLRQLRVTDYQFKDFLAHGNRYNKGFIAEEVEQLFPQAVSKRTDFIPDIYAFAEETTLSDNVLAVSLKDAHNLTEGDTVRLITESDGARDVSVSVVDEKTFAVKDWAGAAGKLFVHGRKVDDFRTLDYQQIFSLAISALQQLAKEVEELKAANCALAERLGLPEGSREATPVATVAGKNSSGNGRH